MSDTAGHALMTALLIILPLSALIARRPPLNQVLKMAGAWIGIFAGGLLVITAIQGSNVSWSRLLSATGLSDRQVVGKTVVVPMSDDGHFWTTVSLNGYARKMMIDSGASVTSVSTATARAAGLDLGEQTFPAMIDTANGATLVKVSTVRLMTVGPIEAKSLKVFVGDNFGDTDVIGMNFLSRLKGWRVEGRRMILEPEPKAEI